MRTKLQLVALSLAALCFLSVGTSGCVSNTTQTNPRYQFTAGTTPPPAVSDLIRYGPAVLLINQRNCRGCEEANPKFSDLQMRYNDTDVRFATFYMDDNITSAHVGEAYAVNVTPTILVIREDGAVAKFIPPPPYPTEVGIDFNAVKSAIDEAQKWQPPSPTPSVTAPTVSVTATYLGESSTLSSSSGTATAPAPGYKFVKFAMYFQNVNTKNVGTGNPVGVTMGNPTEVTLRDKEGNIYSYDIYTYSVKQEVGGKMLGGLTVQTNTQLGDKYSGLIIFQIPISATPKSLTYDDFTNRITINL